jgi:formiminotetrahydrofolate cyclodeaminase
VERTGDWLDLSLRELLDGFASEEPTPGAGSAAALVVAIAAGLCAMVARSSPEWAEARAAVAQAERLWRRVAPLAQADADAYEEALVALGLPDLIEPNVRDATIGGAVGRAADVPLAIAEAAADTAALAAAVAANGAPGRRADVVGAGLLAEAAARAAAQLVAVNLTIRTDDERLGRANAAVEAAAEGARAAVEELGS